MLARTSVKKRRKDARDGNFYPVDYKVDLIDDKADLIDDKVDLIDDKVNLSDDKADLVDDRVDLSDDKVDLRQQGRPLGWRLRSCEEIGSTGP